MMVNQKTFLQKIGVRIGQNTIKDFHLKRIARSIILTGKVHCFYHKQIISTLALKMFPNYVIFNHIEVLNTKEK